MRLKRNLTFILFVLLIFLFMVGSVSALSDSEIEFCKIKGIDVTGDHAWGSDDRLQIANDCYGKLIEEGKDEGICEISSIENYLLNQRNCGGIVPEECNQRDRSPELASCCVAMGIEKVPEQDDCYYGFAVAKSDSNLCQKVTGSFSIEICNFDVALNSENIQDWIRVNGVSKVYISSLMMLLAISFFFVIQRKKPILKRVSFIAMPIFIIVLLLSSFVAILVGNSSFSAPLLFISFFGGLIPGLIFYNLILVPFFIFGWVTLMKKVRTKQKLLSLIYSIIGGSILSIVIFTLTGFTFYELPRDLGLLGVFAYAIMFMVIYAIVFSTLFLVNLKRISNPLDNI